MKQSEIVKKIEHGDYVYTLHAEIDRKADDLTFAQIEKALSNGKILEHYPDSGRGESCLILGFAEDIPIHIVSGWRGDKIVLITGYVPKQKKEEKPDAYIELPRQAFA